ncbi:uncharacterized protein BDZ83DRAFT_319959 [Colletotrichum acutatum]|uniref:Uncharacterized protein n=1 Tax=Glomerella acutata TaxID=27357 RepID=A0AAD8XIT6_GLOAC|nr:uncharacterized protein BDZ83DRAFT_319959 [Colletotrichum acutatum]KAK1724995.1 hypothetical protein BDZ83DRAFT_319959 [Colletotrichum acutatum]
MQHVRPALSLCCAASSSLSSSSSLLLSPTRPERTMSIRSPVAASERQRGVSARLQTGSPAREMIARTRHRPPRPLATNCSPKESPTDLFVPNADSQEHRSSFHRWASIPCLFTIQSAFKVTDACITLYGFPETSQICHPCRRGTTGELAADSRISTAEREGYPYGSFAKLLGRSRLGQPKEATCGGDLRRRPLHPKRCRKSAKKSLTS